MPACKICRARIDLSVTGIRAYKCKECGRAVCRNHYDSGRGICHNCAGLPISTGKVPFSFIRRSSGKS
jgi:hypothetical protein